MNTSAKEEIIRLLEQQKGDDLARARIAFRSLTPQQMQEQHGRSGKTRAEILAGYEAAEQRIDQLIQSVRSAQ